MEIIPEGKHFRLVNESELPEILLVLEQYLPEALKFHQTIKTYLNDRVWKFHFYVSKNWPEEPVCLHFPGCTLTPKNNIYGSFGVFCPSQRIECIDLLDTEDILIDWKESMYLNFTHIAIMNRLDAFYDHKYGIMERLCGDIYITTGLPEDLELESLPAEEVEMRQLTVENVKAIHDLYPASEIECVGVFEKLINTLPGFGVFTKSDGELVAWMMHSYYGAMFSMQTRPEFRRKGYGIHLAKALTQTVLDRGYTPFVVIRPENDASRNLYKKLGFVKAFETCRVTLNPEKLKELNGHSSHANNNNIKNDEDGKGDDDNHDDGGDRELACKNIGNATADDNNDDNTTTTTTIKKSNEDDGIDDKQ